MRNTRLDEQVKEAIDDAVADGKHDEVITLLRRAEEMFLQLEYRICNLCEGSGSSVIPASVDGGEVRDEQTIKCRPCEGKGYKYE